MGLGAKRMRYKQPSSIRLPSYLFARFEKKSFLSIALTGKHLFAILQSQLKHVMYRDQNGNLPDQMDIP